MIHGLGISASVLLYGLAMLALLAGLRGTVTVTKGEQGAIGLAAPALLLHAVLLWQATWSVAGINLSFFNALSLLGWLMALMLVLAAIRQPVHSLGLIIFPIALLGVLLAGITGSPGQTLVPLGAGIDIHVISSVIAYAVLGLASAQALLIAWQEHALRHGGAGAILGLLPPLRGMEALLFQLLGSGFILLSISLVTGWLFVADLFAQDLVHKTVLTMLAWLVFGGLLLGRYRAGWRGRTAIRWTLSGFVLLALGYFGSKAVLELILGR